MEKTHWLELIRNSLGESSDLKKKMAAKLGEPLLQAAEMVVHCLREGHIVLFCGNGGSAADAQHLATEMVVRLSAQRSRKALPAIALTTNTSLLTAAGNDYGFDFIFSRQVEALGQAGDVLVAISTSGRSPNVIQALKEAQSRGMKTIGFLGQEGREMGLLVDIPLKMPSPNPQRVQEGHITAGHILIDLIEQMLFPEKGPG